MDDRVERISGIEPERRVRTRRVTDRDSHAPDSRIPADEPTQSAETLPVVAAPCPPDPPDPGPAGGGFAAYVAQVLGQPGQKRGLRGGPETLERARSTYLETEYSGSAERRIPIGKVKRTEV